MKFFVAPTVLLVISCLLQGDAYRILGISPMNRKSHFAMFEHVMKGLAERGHHVDVVSHYPLKKPVKNYHDVVSLAGTIPDVVNNLTVDNLADIETESFVKYASEDMGNNLCQLLEHPAMKKLIKYPPRNDPYDLVINQILGAHCFLAFGHHLGVPVVGLTTNVPYSWINDFLGNPDNPAYIPNTTQGFFGKMNFWERLRNTVSTISEKIWFNYYTSPQDVIVKRHFGPDAPGVREMERNIALILVNSHFSLTGVRPLTPALVEVGGVHVRDDGPELSPELKKWLDESTDGVVYFTFGSMIKIESLPKKMLASIYASLAKKAPLRFLMKIAKKEELPPGLPGNVKILPWITQFKVLKHRNVRAFITHGGLMSTMEAVICGVPMIGIPLFADQALNINIYENKGIAIRLNYENITEESMDAALNAVMKNPAYRNAARRASAQFLDRPMSAINASIFWIEYVIRNGPAVLRSPSLDLTWWQVALLDVYGFLLLIGLFVAFMLKIIFKKIKAIFSSCNNAEVSEAKKTA